MDCPKCSTHEYADWWSSTDQLWMEYEAWMDGYTLMSMYYCKRCNYQETKRLDPQLYHDSVGEEE